MVQKGAMAGMIRSTTGASGATHGGTAAAGLPGRGTHHRTTGHGLQTTQAGHQQAGQPTHRPQGQLPTTLLSHKPQQRQEPWTHPAHRPRG